MNLSSSLESQIFDFQKITSAFSNSPAFIAENQIINYEDYFDQSSIVAQHLKQKGFKTGDRIAIFSQNSVEYAILLLAIYRIGALAVPLNIRYPFNQILEFIKDINCKTIIQSEALHQQEKNPSIDFLEINQLIKSENSDNQIDISDKIPLHQDATIIFTSGSLSKPKAVLHTFGNHYYNAIGSNLNIFFQRGDKWLLSLPLYHVGGLAILFRAMISGGAVVIPNKTDPLSDSILKYQPTHISLVSTQLYRLMNDEKVTNHLKKMKAILLGGSSIPPNLIQKSIENELPIYTSYGSTEMASQITTTSPNEQFEKMHTSGKVLNHRQLKMAADREILVKGDTLFKGYVKGERYNLDLDSEGWFATGDLGILDSEGYLSVIGRKDNMFISGGENIQPEEIEKELLRIDGVREVIVVPVKNEEFSYRPVAFIDKVDNFPESDFFEKFLQEKIPRFKIPDYFFPLPDDKKNAGIKSNRFFLKTLAEELILEVG
jgi:O-succinylbenzoic acid--CoA ligase